MLNGSRITSAPVQRKNARVTGGMISLTPRPKTKLPEVADPIRRTPPRLFPEITLSAIVLGDVHGERERLQATLELLAAVDSLDT